MPAISVLMKPSSSMCNMSCDYCFYCDEAQKRTQGGEPTLRGVGFFKKVIEFQNQYNRNHVRVQNAFQTNGYAITEEWCQFFKENHFLIGLSVDGTEEIHNSMRHTHSGSGTFARVNQTAMLLSRQKSRRIFGKYMALIKGGDGIINNILPVWIPLEKNMGKTRIPFHQKYMDGF